MSTAGRWLARRLTDKVSNSHAIYWSVYCSGSFIADRSTRSPQTRVRGFGPAFLFSGSAPHRPRTQAGTWVCEREWGEVLCSAARECGLIAAPRAARVTHVFTSVSAWGAVTCVGAWAAFHRVLQELVMVSAPRRQRAGVPKSL